MTDYPDAAFQIQYMQSFLFFCLFHARPLWGCQEEHNVWFASVVGAIWAWSWEHIACFPLNMSNENKWTCRKHLQTHNINSIFEKCYNWHNSELLGSLAEATSLFVFVARRHSDLCAISPQSHKRAPSVPLPAARCGDMEIIIDISLTGVQVDTRQSRGRVITLIKIVFSSFFFLKMFLSET